MGEKHGFAQRQNFESDFEPTGFPQEFLPNWYGNEVRGSSARIFQASGQGLDGSKALAVQPISSFDGRIWVRLTPDQFDNPEVEFYAKALKNGTGTRAALVFYSWGESIYDEFSVPTQIGADLEFANENQEWRKFTLQIPAELKAESELVLCFEIRYGFGTGTAARWLMDDFEFGDFLRDKTPPQVTATKGYSENSILVQFSEKVDPVFSIFPISYELEGKSPEKAELKNDSLAVLTFFETLEQSKNYPLAIRQIPDIAGNFLQDTSVYFAFSDPTNIPKKALVINELMPAPKADQDLPNVEYIEIFHAGENQFRLEGVRLSNSRTEVDLSEYWIQPGEFLILAPESQAFQLEEYGNVMGVKNWPTLLNSGDQIRLIASSGQKIDWISYATSTWGGSEFASGGYSLEVPNFGFLCSNSDLLKPSKEPMRGTPGVQNSIYDPIPQHTSPILQSVYFLDSLRVRVVFSGSILPEIGADGLDFSSNLSIDSVGFFKENELHVLLKSPAQASQVYEVRIVGLRDCFGDPISGQLKSFVLPELPQAGELIINELLFNPRTGEPKFVEIRNLSQRYLNLENWALANLSSSGVADQIKVFGGLGSMLAPGEYLAITTDANGLHLAYPKSSIDHFLQIPTLPSYPIAGGTVVLLSAKAEIAERFPYSEELHHPLLREPKGVSLERISPDTPASYQMNWQSASGNEDFATPGRRNSQTISGEFEGESIHIEPEVFDPQGSSGLQFTSITYELDQPGWMGTFQIYSASGQLVRVLAQNQLLGASGLLTWTGTDSSGKIVRAGYYVLVAELYDPNGRTSVIKKTIVVATGL
ncbi:lamin tail domain-containing protein [Algoriphagus jejuensis]|uniref:Lamin tail domain-containing protein n=1 Tax=Algoriphagus jejuensis TaxID=419934 RepID=A0ABP3YDY4_9BACT